MNNRDPEKNFEVLWETFNKRYPFFELRKVDWKKQYQIYRPKVTAKHGGNRVYMTEVRGFNFEVYRRGMGFVDDLYSKRPDDLMSFLEKSTLERKFISIEKWLERTNVADCSGNFKIL